MHAIGGNIYTKYCRKYCSSTAPAIGGKGDGKAVEALEDVGPFVLLDIIIGDMTVSIS